MSERKPQLLVIVNNFPPDRGGGAAVFGDLCFALSDLGFEVTARCAYPYYPEWRDKSGKNGWKVWRYRQHGVHVERYGLYIPKEPRSVFPRLVHEASFLFSLLRSVGRSRKFDAVMAICPTVSSVVVAAVICALFRKPFWLNVQDLAAEAAVGTGLVRRGLLARTLLGFQRWLFNRADVWSTISPVMLEKIAPMRRRTQPLLMLPNWLDGELETDLHRLHEQGRSGPRSPVRLLYGGNLGMKQNLLALLQELHASTASFRFTIHGDGAQAPIIREWLERVNDPRIALEPMLNSAGFAQALFDNDYFVITEGADAGASFMPSKLVAGLAAGIPILSVSEATSPLGTEVREHDVGPVFGWPQLAEIPAFVAGAANDPHKHKAWSEAAFTRSHAFERSKVVSLYAAGLQEMMRRASPVPAGTARTP